MYRKGKKKKERRTVHQPFMYRVGQSNGTRGMEAILLAGDDDGEGEGRDRLSITCGQLLGASQVCAAAVCQLSVFTFLVNTRRQCTIVFQLDSDTTCPLEGKGNGHRKDCYKILI